MAARRRSDRRRAAGAGHEGRAGCALRGRVPAAHRCHPLRIRAPLHGDAASRPRRACLRLRQGRAGAPDRHVRRATASRPGRADRPGILAGADRRAGGGGLPRARAGHGADGEGAARTGLYRCRRRPDPARPGRHHGPAARGGDPRRGGLPCRRHPRQDDYRRPCRDRCRHRPCDGDAGGGRPGADRRRDRSHGRNGAPPGGARGRRLRPRQPRAQAAPGRGDAGQRRGGVDDRRRGERRAGPEACRCRRRHGAQGHRGGQGGGRNGAGRR